MMRGLPVAGLLAALLLSGGTVQADTSEAEAQVLERAATQPVAMEVQLGFSEKTPSGGFVPITVNLTSRRGNRGVVVLVRSLVAGGNPILKIGPVELAELAPRRLTGNRVGPRCEIPGPASSERYSGDATTLRSAPPGR